MISDSWDIQTETLTTFEYTNSTIRKPHSLLFVGGLGDGLATTSYMVDLVRALQQTEWSLFTLNLTSSYQAWGLGHLDRDTNEIAQCIQYIKDYKTSQFCHGKIVLMGHSTGSQCVLHYLYRPNPHRSIPAFDPTLQHVHRPPLDGAIMQAPVSDREAIRWVLHWGIGGRTPCEVRVIYDKLETMAKESVRQYDKAFDTVLPISLTSQIGYPANSPISSRRFLSLVSPDSPQSPQEDDLFSSDLSDDHLNKTFGMIKQQNLLKYKLMVLISGADQSVPDWVNKEELLVRWRNATDRNGESSVWDQAHSAVIPGASHALSNDDQAEPRKFLTEKVMGYLDDLEKSCGRSQ
ncbi:siderophore biosynthesis lipase esterase [Aspergillus sclerotialis]|uniref:Siderophore biosynthesis lipase esterase n=1 Tax=Aspergillus sclerotialis TaxID=2070753 RepID=A0A3A2ZJK5_9EURO|nr:siderophore biosynthesis lipase esterase [Aspergillus sclerotialis]